MRSFTSADLRCAPIVFPFTGARGYFGALVGAQIRPMCGDLYQIDGRSNEILILHNMPGVGDTGSPGPRVLIVKTLRPGRGFLSQ
jgi:hypothetical protein